ncbi:unnamed protein product [Calypogeia fissa]
MTHEPISKTARTKKLQAKDKAGWKQSSLCLSLPRKGEMYHRRKSVEAQWMKSPALIRDPPHQDESTRASALFAIVTNAVPLAEFGHNTNPSDKRLSSQSGQFVPAQNQEEKFKTKRATAEFHTATEPINARAEHAVSAPIAEEVPNSRGID